MSIIEENFGGASDHKDTISFAGEESEPLRSPGKVRDAEPTFALSAGRRFGLLTGQERG
jgi:hypothetical protein